MRVIRFFTILIGFCLSMSVSAQKQLTSDGQKAQKALVEYLRSIGITTTIDTRDNSVCFKTKDVFYWVTFDESSPVLYTIHRKGLKFDDDPAFKPSCARVACNEVNRKHNIKCTTNEKHVDFMLQTYAKNPSDFHGGFDRMLNAFKDVDVTFKNTYDKTFDAWVKDSIARSKPITPDVPLGVSPLKVTAISFGNFDSKNFVITDFDQPLRKSSVKYIRTKLEIESTEKGIFKVGMKIFNPDKKAMIATKGVEYCTTSNIEIKKSNKKQEFILDSFGSNTDNFWKAGEYRVEIYDFEKGSKLYTTTFNIL